MGGWTRLTMGACMAALSKKRRQIGKTIRTRNPGNLLGPALVVMLLFTGPSFLSGRINIAPNVQASETVRGDAKAGAARSPAEGLPQKPKAPRKMPVPLTGGSLIFEPGPSGAGIIRVTNAPPSITFESSQKRQFEGLDTLRAQKSRHAGMIVKLADTRRDRFAIIEIFMVGENTDALIARANSTRPKLYQGVMNLLSSKTAAQLDGPGGRQFLRSEILDLCHQILGPKIVDEILITRLIHE